MGIEEQGRSDIWVLDVRRATLSRLTFHPDNDFDPVWTPDGRRIAWSSWQADVGALNLFWQKADGTGQPARLTTSRNRQGQASWHPGGRLLAFTEVRPGTVQDLMVLPIEGDETSGFRPGTPEPFLSTPSLEFDPQFSPDGRWIAYTSNVSGATEVYVRPYPGPGGTWQVSAGSGRAPRWSRSKPELYYSAGNRIMAVPYEEAGGSFAAGTPRPWADLPAGSLAFDWHPDGERLALVEAEQGAGGRLSTRVLVFSMFDELRRRAPRGPVAARP